MSLPHILLGMLHEPASGYDLKNHMSRSLSHFWRAELSQIYPQLKKMELDGLLSSSERGSEKGPTRRVYKRTAKGTKALIEWLSNGPGVGNERITYLAQVYFLDSLKRTEDVIAFMEELRAYMVGWLEDLRGAEDEWRACDPGYPDELSDENFFAQLTLALGLKNLQGNIDWCDECLERIRARITVKAGAL